jgi:methionyl aminopeptidase
LVLRKTPEQIAVMRRAGRVVAEMHEACILAAKPGATTADLDAAAREVLDRRGARSNFLNYHGFPAVACISPNEVIVHGIPGDRVIDDGDIVSIDCGAIVEGWHGDAAITIPVGTVDEASLRLLEVGRAALDAGIAMVAPGNRLGDIGAAVEGVARAAGYSVVREYVGHGIGTAMHEDPEVPNYGAAGRGMRLREGMVLAIEPMVNVGRPTTRLLDDGWTVVTADGSRSAHFEHSVAVTADGPEVLTVL